MTDRRQVKDVRLKGSFPFVEVYERDERKWEMSAAAVGIGIILAIAVSVSPIPISAGIYVLGGVIAGGLIEHRRQWERLYGE